MEKEKSRMINCNFPARALIIDTASPSCSDVVENICIALTNVFAMISELPGQCRVPTCSLFMTGSRNECLFPLQPIKGNFLKLYMSIEELKIQNCHDQSLVHSKEILKRAINEAVSQFKRWSLTMKTGQRIGNTCQVEICIITCKKQNVLESDLAEAFPGFDFEVLKKIQVINVEQLECCLDDKMKNASLDCDKSNDTDALHEYIEFNSLSNDVTAFEQTFKSWIIDIGSDDVHLTIDLPSSSPKEGGIQLKCDLEDRFLNPLDLPHCQRMFMRTGFQNCPTINQQSRKMNSSVPIAHVFALKWIKASGVCESLLYGQPLIVKPTSCWKLDWDDLDLNQQHFQVLRSILKEKGHVLLLASRSTSNAQQMPIGFFVLMPSDGSSMLLKSVASRDLLLPVSKSLCMEKHSSTIRENIEESIRLLPRSDLLNPFELDSGIAKKIVASKTKAVARAVPKKRQLKENSSCSTTNVFQGTQQWNKSKHYKAGM